MPDAPGYFHFAEVEGPAKRVLYNWVLVNTAGDVIATSFAPVSGKTAAATAQWIIDNASDFEINKILPGATRH